MDCLKCGSHVDLPSMIGEDEEYQCPECGYVNCIAMDGEEVWFTGEEMGNEDHI